MIIDIRQQNKKMFEANFEIVSNNNILGKIILQTLCFVNREKLRRLFII